MSRDLNDLDPDFAATVQRLLTDLGKGGIEMRPFWTRRDVFVQARLYRQSRSKGEIDRACRRLHANGAHWLAEVIESVGPQYGRWATNALPGLSWHQHGLAIDCFRVRGTDSSWAHEDYRRYAEAARAQGLTAGFFWHSRDAVHVQLPPVTTKVLHRYTYRTLDAAMRAQFG